MSERPHSDIDPREMDPASGEEREAEVQPGQVDPAERSGGAESGTSPEPSTSEQAEDKGQGEPDAQDFEYGRPVEPTINPPD